MKLFDKKITEKQKNVIQRVMSIIMGLLLTLLIFKTIPLLKVLIVPVLAYVLYQFVFLLNGIYKDSTWNAITYTIFFSGFIGFPATIKLIQKTFNFIDLFAFFGLVSLSFCLLIILFIRLFYIKNLFTHSRHHVFRVLIGIPLFVITMAVYLNYTFTTEKISEENIEIAHLNKRINDDNMQEYSVYVKFRSKIVEIKITEEQFYNLNKNDLLKINYKKGCLSFYIIDDVEKLEIDD